MVPWALTHVWVCRDSETRDSETSDSMRPRTLLMVAVHTKLSALLALDGVRTGARITDQRIKCGLGSLLDASHATQGWWTASKLHSHKHSGDVGRPAGFQSSSVRRDTSNRNRQQNCGDLPGERRCPFFEPMLTGFVDFFLGLSKLLHAPARVHPGY